MKHLRERTGRMDRRSWFKIISVISFAIAILTDILPFELPVSTVPDVNEMVKSSLGLLFMSLAACFILLYLLETQELPAENLEGIQGRSAAEKPYTMTVDFLVGRFDALEKIQHDTRSGASILMGVFSAMILWLLNFGGTLTSFQNAVVRASGVAVAIISWAIMLSFRIDKVESPWGTLGEDLLATGQSEEVFKEQLSKLVGEKYAVVRRMKETIGFAVGAFIEIVGLAYLADMFGDLTRPSVLPVFILQVLSFIFLIFALLLFILVVLRETSLG